MRINLTSFLIGIIFCLIFVLFSGGIFIPKHLKVNSIEVIDEGKDNSGFIIIRNYNNQMSTYLGVGQNNNGVLTMKNPDGETKVNIGSNENGGYFRSFNTDNEETIFIGNDKNKNGVIHLAE
tara:strand:- start:455 stop:820 length:366 start_codon:yes stop_codon:yes gene_type:complete